VTSPSSGWCSLLPDSPCSMCTGAILLYKIPRVVIGENANWVGGEELLKSNGVQVVVLDDPECTALMARYIKEKPEVSQRANVFYCSHTVRKMQDWNEDIGE
jgi:tRNA(Arg) A34 adenosine deaminase TadA